MVTVVAGRTAKAMRKIVAVRFARYIVDYCYPVLHQYFKDTKADDYYEEITKPENNDNISKEQRYTQLSMNDIVEYILRLKNYYWTEFGLCLGQSYCLERRLVSDALIELLNEYGDDDTFRIPVLCRFTIQLLFGCEVGDFYQQSFTMTGSMKCRSYSQFLEALAPFNIVSLDTVYMIFGIRLPIVCVLNNSPELRKLFLYNRNLTYPTIDQVSGISGLEEIGMHGNGNFFKDFCLFPLLFYGKSQEEVTKAVYRKNTTRLTFPNLKKFYLTCTKIENAIRPLGGSFNLAFCLAHFYPNVTTNVGIKYDDCNVKNMVASLQPPMYLRRKAKHRFNSLKFRKPNPSLFNCTRDFSDCVQVKYFEVIGHAQWYFENSDVLFDIIRGLRCIGFNMTIIPDSSCSHLEHSNKPYKYYTLFDDIGYQLMVLTLQVGNFADVEQIICCIARCPALAKLSIILLEICSGDYSRLLDAKVKPLHNLLALTLSGTLESDSLWAPAFFDKIIKAAPYLVFLSLIGDVTSSLPNIADSTFEKVRTLHLRDYMKNSISISKVLDIAQTSTSLEMLVLEDIGDSFTRSIKRTLQHTRLKVILGQRYSFSRSFREFREVKKTAREIFDWCC